MDTKELVEKIKNESKSQAHVFKDDEDDCVYRLDVRTSKILCSIEISTKISSADDKKDIISKLNSSQPLFKYTVDKNELKCAATMIIDKTPTQKGYADLISMVLSNIKSVKLMYEVCNDET